jgi:hypothetical protein
MGPDDASSAEMRRLPLDPDTDPLALDDETVERLLAGELSPDQAPPGYAEVAELLAAATAAPTRGELAGQAAVLAELRAVTGARRAPAHVRRAARPPRRRWAGLVAVALVGALVTGGAAVAATGQLLEPVRAMTRSILDTVGGTKSAARTTPGPPASAPATRAAGPGGDGQGPPSTAAADRGRGTAGAAPGANPDLEGLCQAYLAGKGSEHGRKLGATAFDALARAARGPDQVDAYCQDLLPGTAEPEKEKNPPSDDQSQEQGQGQGGPPSSTGGGTERTASSPGPSSPSR